MKKFIGLVSLLSVLSFTACSESEEITPNGGGDPIEGETLPSKTITIVVDMPQEVADEAAGQKNSRIAFDDSKLSLTWEAGDQLLVHGYDQGGYKGASEFTMTEGAGSNAAKFTGKTVAGATEYIVYYKSKGLSFNGNQQPVVNYNAQQMSVKAPTALLKDFLLIQSEKVAAADLEKGAFRLAMQNGIMRFDIASTPADMGALTSLEWTNNIGTAQAATMKVELNNKALDEDIDSFGDQGSATVPFSVRAAKANELTTFITFNAAEMELLAGQKITVVLHGTKRSYRLDATSSMGKKYQNGYRYYIKVSTDTSDANALSNWQAI